MGRGGGFLYLRVASVLRCGRPIRTDREFRRCEFGKHALSMDNLAADDLKVRFKILDVFLGN
jgi:hypothetical protein